MVGGQQARDSQAAEAEPQTGLIMGTVVVAGTGQPADGVRLSLSGGNIRGSRSTLTDGDGRFAFPALPEGTFSLRGTKTGYVNAQYGQKSPGRPGTPIFLKAGQQLKELSLEIPKGGVIAGVVYDEKNRPAVGIPVRVMRWSMQTGERTLVSAGTSTSDDRGMYRVYGLAPGQYLVSAMPRNSSGTIVTSGDIQNIEMMQVMMQEQEAQLQYVQSGAAGQPTSFSFDFAELPAGNTSKEPVSGYSPVYFPGTTQPGTASEVTVGVSQEQLGIDFQLQRIGLSSVKGQVVGPPGMSVSNIRLRMFDHANAAPGVQTFSARTGRDGTFTFTAVPPGQYTMMGTATLRQPQPKMPVGLSPAEMERVVAEQRSTARNKKLWASAEVVVGGGFQPNVVLSLQSGMAVSGSLEFIGTANMPADLKRVRISLAPRGKAMSSIGVGTTRVNADENGRFTLRDVVPGQYRVSASGASGWSLKTVMIDGQDALDFGLDVMPGEDRPNVTASFGSASTELTGTLESQLGEPTADYTVIIFPSDPRYWVPFARRMRSVRPSTDGKFSFRGLPPGDYRLATVTDIESGAWFDPLLLEQLKLASISVSLIENQPVVQDLRVNR